MVVENRIACLRRMFEYGAKLSATVAVNQVSNVQSVRIVVDPSVIVDCALQSGITMVLDFLDNACDTHTVRQTRDTSILMALQWLSSFSATSRLSLLVVSAQKLSPIMKP